MDKLRIEIPETCLVALVGGSSSGKSSFAAKHFKPTEILSSDFFRGMVSDNENDQTVTADAFELLYAAADKRLNNMKLTVIDATNIQKTARSRVLACAKEHDLHVAAIVLDMPVKLMLERNAARPDRMLPERIIRRHSSEAKRCIGSLKKEGFRFVYVISSPEQLENVEIVRTKLWNDKRGEHDPLDIIGDIHGCCGELEALLEKLGYIRENGIYTHPEGRKAAFLGDFCDRGPRNADVLRLVMDMVKSGNAISVLGNHDVKLLKYLRGKNVQQTHGLDVTVAELEKCGKDFRAEVAEFIDGLISHYVLDDGRLVIAHAGLKEPYIGRSSGRVREFCLYGETTGETDEYGFPVRLDWTADYRGRAAVVYGHIAGGEVKAVNNTWCIDTGCVFGGKLTAFRYPEKELVSVSALREYYPPVRPLAVENNEITDDTLSVGDISGRIHIETRLFPNITVPENNAAAALEIMSRFAADPHWLIYLPPTMSPCETSGIEGKLEHPSEAFDYYRRNGVKKVVCEQKHMGSRAVIVICRNTGTATKRFGVTDGSRGIIYTRTGRRFFDDQALENELLDRLDRALTASDFWGEFGTDWVCLDCELMPWSEKAQSLLKRMYAPVGRAGKESLSAAAELLEKACRRENISREVDKITSGQNADLPAVLDKFRERLAAVGRYSDAYAEYCWKVGSADDLRIAPFHILACEGKTFLERDHVWHMETIKKYITGTDKIFIETPYFLVDTEDDNSVREGIDRWTKLTESGGEGMVVKPFGFIAWKDETLLQPAVKCRGREYLRIIYGAEYLLPEHLDRLKKRSLSRKRALALKEFALGAEALERFTANEPLYKVHECVFGVLAFESEPVDPRL